MVDMQNDFAAKGGIFDRVGIDISVNRNAVEPTSRTLASMRKAGIGVIFGHILYLLNAVPVALTFTRHFSKLISPVPCRIPARYDAIYYTSWKGVKKRYYSTLERLRSPKRA